jgi:hypothetical protein
VIIPATFAQVNFRFGGVACPTGAEVTLGIAHQVDPLETPTSVADRCRDAWVAAIMPQLSNQVTLVEVLCKFGPNDTGAQGSVTDNTVGGIGIEAYAPNTAILVRKVTAGGGRRERGRMYIPGPAETAIAGGGELLPATVLALQGALDNFHTALDTGGLPPVLLHALGATVVPPPSTILSFEVQSRIGTQRLRNRR